MRKRLFSLCMALALCLGLLPGTALAADGDVSYGTIEVGSVALTNTRDTPVVYATTDDSGNVITEGADENNYNVMWDGSTLTLWNATIQQAEEYSDKNKEKIAVYLASGDLNLALVGENTVDAPGNGTAASCGINLGKGNLTISGEGDASLSVFGGPTTNGNSCGIYANGTITIDSGTVTVTGESASAASYGICASGAVTIEDGTLNAASGKAGGNSCGIYTSNSVIIEDGSLNAASGEAGGNSCGIYASNSVTIEDGTVNATGGNAVRESYGIYASSFTINGGTVVATGGEAANRYSMGVRADGGITINDGVVTATGGTAGEFSYGMYTGGTITINGGIITAESSYAGLSYGIRCGTCLITDGTVTATSGKTYQDCIGIYAKYNITIKGGAVTAMAGESVGEGAYNFGIRSHNGSITIEGGTVTATGGTAHGTVNNMSSGLFAKAGSITVSGGTVTATGGESTRNGDENSAYSTGFFARDAVTVSGGTVTATGGTVTGTAGAGGSYGIFVESKDTSTVTINGNSVVRANMTGEEGVDGKTISGKTIERENGIVFENGEGTVYGTVTLQEDLTVGADESLTIPHGATLTIPDGTTLTNSGTITNDGTIDNQGALTIRPGGGLAGSGTVTGNSVEWPYTPPPANPNYRIDVTTTEGGTVTKDPAAAKAGETVTLTPAPEEGYEVGDVTVTDRFGDTVEVTENADGTYTFTLPNGQVSVNVTFVEVQTEPLPFTDVSETDWFHDAVQYVYDNGLMGGVGDNRFAPNNPTTRAQLVTILYRLEGEPAVTGQSGFTDVEPDTWYTNAVAWAAANGIVNGVSETQFAPGNNITREQLATILFRYAEAKGYDVSAAADLSGFPDAGDIQSYATQALSWAVAEGLLQGFEDDTLRPQGNATRAQIATILMRFCQTVAE